jgi:hypothetical protein
MRLGLLLLVLFATLFGSGYWYNTFNTVCRVPMHYHIGSIDERFGTDTEEIKRIAKNAEAVWENPFDEELFVYDESKGFPINLVFDERQETANLEEELKEDLTTKEGMSESVSAQYESLIKEFRSLKKAYEEGVIAYERKLEAYNTQVTEWNNKGGAPKEELEKLHTTQNALIKEQYTLESRALKLNELVSKLNAIGARGNSLITDYNTIVNEYNDTFSTAREFTQGDYTGKAIHVYQFDSEDELTIVLAHEFGHALSLNHVENEKSIMYPVMGAQEKSEGITPEDKAEFEHVCNDKSIAVRILGLVSDLF